MPSLPTLLLTLGTRGAADNARSAIAARRREDWLVAGLVRRLDAREPVEPAAPALAAGTNRVA